MSDNHYAPARVADNAGRAQVIGARFVPDYTLTPTASSVWSAWNTGFTVSGDWLVLGAYVKILGASAATLTAFIQHQLATGAAWRSAPSRPIPWWLPPFPVEPGGSGRCPVRRLSTRRLGHGAGALCRATSKCRTLGCRDEQV
jgi:hypothetical protein